MSLGIPHRYFLKSKSQYRPWHQDRSHHAVRSNIQNVIWSHPDHDLPSTSIAARGALHPILACSANSRCRSLYSIIRTRCLSTISRGSSSPPSSSVSALSRLSSMRNIGIIAHIDAGKTTTTERCLYYGHKIRHMGNVDRGDTTMDFLPAERDRGITIKAATISFTWQDHIINIIDTPGHVDFTQEVESSLRVCDSCVLIIDAVKGVQAQTHTVYTQAQRYHIPCIAYINKMDRDGANLGHAINSIHQRLAKQTLRLQIPVTVKDDIYSSESFVGIIDLIHQEEWRWKHKHNDINDEDDDGTNYTIHRVDTQHPLYDEMKVAREVMLEKIAEYDDEFLTLFLNNDSSPSINQIITAIRRLVCKNILIPILCGASLRNKGVQPLLNAIVAYAPSPLDQQQIPVYECIARKKKGKHSAEITNDPLHRTDNVITSPDSVDHSVVSHQTSYGTTATRTIDENGPLLALAFKVTHDLSRGAEPIIFIRVYSGVLHAKSMLLNTTIYHRRALMIENQKSLADTDTDASPSEDRSTIHQHGHDIGIKERPLKLLRIDGEDSEEIQQINTGEIGAIIGLKHTITGDTLIKAQDRHLPNAAVYLPSIPHPDPVFFASIEADKHSDDPQLQQALLCLQREDPSLSVSEDEETGQTIMRGMGELHLEIIYQRLIEDYKVKATMGKMRVAYRESIIEPCSQSMYHCLTSSTTANTSLSTSLQISSTTNSGDAILCISLLPLPPSSGIVIDVSHAEKLSVSDAIEIMKTSPSSTAINTAIPSYPASNTVSSMLTPTLQHALIAAIHTAVQRGPLLGYALTDMQINLTHYFLTTNTLAASSISSSTSIIRSCAIQLIRALLRHESLQDNICLLEPMMQVIVNVEKQHIGDIINELTARRRGLIREITVTPHHNNNHSNNTDKIMMREREEINAEVPLTELMGYANDLRSRTGGTASFSMHFLNYQPVPSHIQQKLLQHSI